jgi:hypothetical protein
VARVDVASLFKARPVPIVAVQLGVASAYVDEADSKARNEDV